MVFLQQYCQLNNLSYWRHSNKNYITHNFSGNFVWWNVGVIFLAVIFPHMQIFEPVYWNCESQCLFLKLFSESVKIRDTCRGENILWNDIYIYLCIGNDFTFRRCFFPWLWAGLACVIQWMFSVLVLNIVTIWAKTLYNLGWTASSVRYKSPP